MNVIKIVIITLFAQVAILAGLTKMDIIPNVFNLSILNQSGGGYITAKPIIYLYPEDKTEVTVNLDYKGNLIADYPSYDNDVGGWQVLAYPNGTLFDMRDNQEYSYIFWEGDDGAVNWDMPTGFIVPGSDSRAFLKQKLAYLGLTPKEYNEFIVYWYPKMMNNKYNLVHFAQEQYTDLAPLSITPEPDSMLRVFMLIKPLEEPFAIQEQILEPFKRTGFSVVEWGGSYLDNL